MKKTLLAMMILAACGNKAANNELVGQVKKLTYHTPLICPDYVEVDISLGILQNGNGSLSKEDVFLVVEHAADVSVLKRAAESGVIVKVMYDTRRLTICWPDHRVTEVIVIPPGQPVP